MADPPRPAPRRTPRVLVVEDEPRLRALLADELPEMGYDPLTARTAEEARRLIDEYTVDIIILDLNLPVTDGLTLLRALRRDGHTMPVMIMTGFGDLAAAREAIHLDVVEFLTKPCHLGEIEAALDRARRRLAAPAARGFATPQPPDPPYAPAPPSPPTLAESERKLILDALRHHDGNRTATAAALGISRRTLYNKLAEYEADGEFTPDA